METPSDTYLQDTRREYARALIEKLLREVRHVEQQYPAANCGVSAMCALAFGRVPGCSQVEEPVPTPRISNTQGTASRLANLESRWRLGLVPLQEYRMERRHLSRRLRLARFDEKPLLGYAVDAGARLLEWFEYGLTATVAITERLLSQRVKTRGEVGPVAPLPLQQLCPIRSERLPSPGPTPRSTTVSSGPQYWSPRL